MDNGASKDQQWCFSRNEHLDVASAISIRGILTTLINNLNEDDTRSVVPLGHGDPSSFPSFRTTPAAEDAVIEAIRSAKFNCYSPPSGFLPARRAIAEYLSHDLSYKVSPDDIHLTAGCVQAIEVMITVLARPGANILLPRPGFPAYEARAAFSKLEARHFDLLPGKGWEVDLDSVEALADKNTVAIVVINPGNPCGTVFTKQHMKKVAEMARKLGIFVISDEVYDHLAFGDIPFIPMAEFASIVPVVTLGSISKRWMVPGWRLGWIVANDPNGILKKYGIVDGIKNYLNITTDAPTFVQGAIPRIIEQTREEFFTKTISTVRNCADICYEKIKEVPCINCPHKPDGSMFVMVKLDLSMLEDIIDDRDFCLKLAAEENVIVLPGFAVGLKNWLRITFAVEIQSLEEGFERIKTFYQRHAKKQQEF